MVDLQWDIFTQLETDLFGAMSRIRGQLKTSSCWESNPGPLTRAASALTKLNSPRQPSQSFWQSVSGTEGFSLAPGQPLMRAYCSDNYTGNL